MEQNQQFNPPEQGVYKTGSTRPPKHNQGVLAVLLGLVIFLGGISSILRFMNIQLFHQLSPDPIAIRFSPTQEAVYTGGTIVDTLGVSAEAISEPYRRYYRLPAGLFITTVGRDTPAHKAGLQRGDILLNINGTRVKNLQELKNALEACPDSEPFVLIFYREGVHFTATVLPDGDGN